MTVLEPAMTAAQVASVAVFGTLASTIFSGFHASVLGVTFDTYDLLILIPGVLCVLAGVIAFVGLRCADSVSIMSLGKGSGAGAG